MLSLEALLAGRLSAAVADDDVDTIRLPSHGLAKEVINGSDAERPWKCCDRQLCTRSLPPFCFCRDRVKHCASTCKRCEVDEEDSSLHVCRDRYHGFPGPRCTKDVNDDDNNIPSGVAEEVISGRGEERPWKCCDVPICIRSFPPRCVCADKVKHCASTCKSCEKDEEDPSRHVCNDWYHGFPGPSCTKDANGDDNNVPSGVADDHQVTVAATTEAGKKKERPWKCCDDAICGMSFPPICFCRDKVERCAAACKHCEKDEEDSSRYICADPYRGDAGPKCTKDGNGDGSNNDVPSGVARDHQVMAAAAANVGKTKGGNKERPWKCCDEKLCSTKVDPPMCLCKDKVKRCDPACKRCFADSSDPSLFRCYAIYQGDPGPRCTVIGAGDN